MGWKEELLRLYERHSSEAGIIHYKERVPYVLLPLFHTTAIAHIQVVLSSDGEFISASKVDGDDKMIVIPITEKSGSRTAGKAPHALCDNLKYLAGDYERYVRDKKNDAAEYHEDYMKQLEKWHLSQYTHEKVEVIYQYLKKGSLIQDLLREKVLESDDTGLLADHVKIGTEVQSKAMVRFVIRNRDGLFSEIAEECWKDKTLQECYIQYCRSRNEAKDLDYLTGAEQPVSYLHSRKIRSEGDGAKLISSNDETDFTFRGRFATKEQAFSIGNESSQKIHNALKWIIRKQGSHFDSLTIVTWESNDQQMPMWNLDTEEIISEYETFAEEFQDTFTYETEDQESYSDENPITAKRFYEAMNGYRKKIEHISNMFLMAFDAATPGRLGLVEYRELESARYLEHIRNWHEQGSWLQRNKKGSYYYGVPGVRDIAELLYGIEIDGKIVLANTTAKKLYKQVSSRLLPCIWDGRLLPMDFVTTAVNKASSPQCYRNRYNWERVLMAACSFVKKSRYEREQKEVWHMALDTNCNIRDYLYGRLLAVADRVEYRTYDKEKDMERVTNAKRYMSTFSQRPFETWKVIEENLQPYLNKLPVSERRYYENIIDEINDKFEVDEYSKNEKLDGLYLLGFHSQSYDLKQYKKEQKGDQK